MMVFVDAEDWRFRHLWFWLWGLGASSQVRKSAGTCSSVHSKAFDVICESEGMNSFFQAVGPVSFVCQYGVYPREYCRFVFFYKATHRRRRYYRTDTVYNQPPIPGRAFCVRSAIIPLSTMPFQNAARVSDSKQDIWYPAKEPRQRAVDQWCCDFILANDAR
jgi:hypothetical protein